MVIVADARPAALRAIARLSQSDLGADELLRQVTDYLRRLIPFDTGSWLLYDPDALLPVGAVAIDDTPSYDLRLAYCANEHLQDDVNKFRDLARRRVPAATLAATPRRAVVIASSSSRLAWATSSGWRWCLVARAGDADPSSRDAGARLL
jgi:GAF domain-containing protein